MRKAVIVAHADDEYGFPSRLALWLKSDESIDGSGGAFVLTKWQVIHAEHIRSGAIKGRRGVLMPMIEPVEAEPWEG